MLSHDIAALFKDKSVKPKEKVAALTGWLLDGTLDAGALVTFAGPAKDPVKAGCMEALEFVTQQRPQLATKAVFLFAVEGLSSEAPRVKWESAKVIGNTAQLFVSLLDKAIAPLLDNSEHTGTVVRWSAAFALGKILELKTKHNSELLPALEAVCLREEKNSIKKVYLAAIKKVKG